MTKKRKQSGMKHTLTPEEVIEKRRRYLANVNDIKSFFARLVFMIILMWGLFGVIFGITPMKNDDMMPRISAGDLLFYYRLENDWHIQDVIVFEMNGEQYVGRIIAQMGDVVEVTDQAQLILNGSVIQESDIYYMTLKYESDVEYPLQIREDEFFVLCDYREGAKDSRYFGVVDMNDVKGKVITVIRRSNI